ncbi:MAG: hypothetical protein MR033_05280 [Clostridiales bacterium]|nr:hypothetical protein [Clostridiales bacterium]
MIILLFFLLILSPEQDRVFLLIGFAEERHRPQLRPGKVRPAIVWRYASRCASFSIYIEKSPVPTTWDKTYILRCHPN